MWKGSPFLTFTARAMAVPVHLGSFVVRDAPHHPGLPGHLGLGCGVGLGGLPRLHVLFLGLDDLLLGRRGWGFGRGGFFVGRFHGILGFLIIGVL